MKAAALLPPPVVVVVVGRRSKFDTSMLYRSLPVGSLYRLLPPGVVGLVGAFWRGPSNARRADDG